jgi:hypothetical protein
MMERFNEFPKVHYIHGRPELVAFQLIVNLSRVPPGLADSNLGEMHHDTSEIKQSESG